MKINSKFLLITIISLLVCVISQSRVAASDVVAEKTFDIVRGQVLEVRSDVGSVSVTTWDRERVEVIIENRSQGLRSRSVDYILDKYDFDLGTTSRGVSVIVASKSKQFLGNWSSGINLHFEIKVPTEFDLDIKTAGGSIDVSDIKGDMALKTSGGSVKMGSIDGSVVAESSGGGITLGGATSDVDISTSGGGIKIGETRGKVTAKTSGGSVTVDGASGDTYVSTSGGGITLKNIAGNIHASTSGGGIHAEFVGDIDSDCELKTSGGGITVLLSENIRADIDASTSGGSVVSDFPVTVQVQGKLKSNKLAGKINGGGPLLLLKTSGGNIHINKR